MSLRNSVWETSRGSGGFKASYESIKARGEPGDYEVVFTCPTSVRTLAEGIDAEDDAIEVAKEEARDRGFEVEE